MKIFVTGGAGFIGGNFILDQILNKQNNILNYDKLTYAGNLNTLEKVNENPNYHFVEGDICNRDFLRSIILQYKPDAIVHFAAESHVDRSIDEPTRFIETNVMGTAILLSEGYDYYKNSSCKFKDKFRFLHISTDEVYGSLGENNFFIESTPYDPSSPYSASKASSDHLVRAWHKTYGFPILITNCSNNYGPYQFPEKLIPLMILNCIAGKNLPVYGKGNNIRDWLYVEDHCDAIYTVLNKGVIGSTYNIGGNNEIKNIDIVKIICHKMDSFLPRSNGSSYSDLITFVTDRPGHDFRYAIDASKIQNNLGWAPRENFNSGIEKTITWYLENKEWWKSIQNNSYRQERLGVIE
tara:strand:- start:284 stop:1339 length:1056 start_codon:yes stop_codon:yes gene_type:complete